MRSLSVGLCVVGRVNRGRRCGACSFAYLHACNIGRSGRMHATACNVGSLERMQRRRTSLGPTGGLLYTAQRRACMHGSPPSSAEKKQAQKNVSIRWFIDAKALENPYNVKKLQNLAMMLVMLVQGCWSTSRMSTKTCFETDPSRPERPPMKQVQNDTEFCQDVSPMRSTLVHVGQCGTDRRRR